MREPAPNLSRGLFIKAEEGMFTLKFIPFLFNLPKDPPNIINNSQSHFRDYREYNTQNSMSASSGSFRESCGLIRLLSVIKSDLYSLPLLFLQARRHTTRIHADRQRHAQRSGSN